MNGKIYQKKLKGEKPMSKKNGVKRICSFCVSNWHLVTMLMPYISQKIENENVVMLLEEDMSEIASEFLKHITLEDKLKEMFENLKWQKTSCKYSAVKEMLTESVKQRKDVNFIIFGSEEYIKKMNENINKWMNNNKKALQNIFVQIIDAYEVMQFNNNLNDILSVHDKILNTSGEKKIEEVFEGYKKIV